jgi:hypothetical protein
LTHTYEKTAHKTIHNQPIYAEIRFDGLIRYKVKSKQNAMQYKGRKWVSKTISTYRDIDPAEAPELFEKYPERFSGYIKACIRESMLQGK